VRALEAVVALGRPGQQLRAEVLRAMRAIDLEDRRLGRYVGHASTVAERETTPMGDCAQGATRVHFSQRRSGGVVEPKKSSGRPAAAAPAGCPEARHDRCHNRGLEGVRWTGCRGGGRRGSPAAPGCVAQGQMGPTPARNREAATRAALAHAATQYRSMLGPSFRSYDSPGPGLTRVYKGAE
jgi:hypothetical protein